MLHVLAIMNNVVCLLKRNLDNTLSMCTTVECSKIASIFENVVVLCLISLNRYEYIVNPGHFDQHPEIVFHVSKRGYT